MYQNIRELIRKRVRKEASLYRALRSIELLAFRWKSIAHRLGIFVRVQRPITAAFGPLYRRNRETVELDVAYACNLRCPHCNRSCPQAPSADRMDLDQIRKFIDESVRDRVQWGTIRVLGGEPTLHPDIAAIMGLLLGYKKRHSPATCISMITNGSGEFVKSVLARIPEGVMVRNTEKEDGIAPFEAFNRAPCDSFLYRHADYSNACKLFSYCGMGLTPYGYYPCAVAGSIDRVFGWDLGRKALPAADDPLTDHLGTFCRLCGHFGLARQAKGEKVSPTWGEAYARYRKRRPTLTRY